MPTKAQRRAKLRRMDAAIAALTPLGFEKKQIRDTVNGLVKVYGDTEAGWYFLEEDYYRLVIETMIKDQDVEQQRSNVVHEEQNVENEEQDEGDGAFEDATERENSGREIVLFEPGSSSNMVLSGRGEYSADERALVNFEVGQSSADERALVNFEVGEYSADERALQKLADCCAMVRGIEHSQVSPSSIPPEGSPSFYWISEEEEEEEEKKPFLPKREPKRTQKRTPKRAPCYGWISEEEDDDD